MRSSIVTDTMKKSKSAPSLTSLIPSKVVLVQGNNKPNIRRNVLSCGVLSSLDAAGSPATLPVIEQTAVYVSKVPLTQVYQCMNRLPPHLSSDDDADEKDLATCIATPHDPVERDERDEREREAFAMRSLRNNMGATMSRYQYWWDRVKKQKKYMEDNAK